MNHRTGQRGKVIAFNDNTYALSAFPQFKEVDDAETDGEAEPSKPFVFDELSVDLQQLIRSPDYAKFQRDRSRAVFAAACGMVREGVGDNDGAAVLLNPSYRISEHVREQANPSRAALRAMVKARKAVHEERNRQQFDVEEGPEPSQNERLEHMNNEWAVVRDGGKTRVMTFKKDIINTTERSIPEFFSAADFKMYFINRFVRIPGGENEPDSFIELGKWWLGHARRRQYRGLIFDPKATPLGVIEGRLNLWRGFSIKPVQGDWSLMQRHIAEVLAASSSEAEEYLLNWTAFLFQHPDVQAEVAAALIGPKGGGKGVFGNMLCRIFSQHGLHIASPSHLTGQFNAHQRDCCFIFADKSYWQGNKMAAGALQRLITEPDLAIEGKGKDLISCPNRMHILVAAEPRQPCHSSRGTRAALCRFQSCDGARAGRRLFHAAMESDEQRRP